jgi:hypothetical protein
VASKGAVQGARTVAASAAAVARRRLGGFGRDLVRLFRRGWMGRASGNLTRFFVAPATRTFQTSRQFFARWRGLFGRNVGRWGWTQEHAWIKQWMYRGDRPFVAPGTWQNRWLQRLGDAGWNLYPMPRWLNSTMAHYPITSGLLNASVYGASLYAPYKSWSLAAEQLDALRDELERAE